MERFRIHFHLETYSLSSNDDHDGAVASLDCLETFEPHRLCPGGWLQTLSIKTLSPDLDVERWPGAISIKIQDDHRPPDTMTGYYLPPKSDEICKPTVLLFHGMGGHALSGYMQSIAGTLLGDGFPVVLWNHRGSGDSSTQCTHYHHPGKTDDIERLVSYVIRELPRVSDCGINAVGFSLGANAMLCYLAEQGDDCVIGAAMSISAPLDMEITSKNLRKGSNRLFDRYLLKKQRDEVLRPGADISESERQIVRNASSVWELDDQFTAKRFGSGGASQYYESNSAIHVLDAIRTPTLLLHAMDDPVVDTRVFSQRRWTDDGPLFAALAASGGHTGFLGNDGKRWHEQCAVNFFNWRLR